MELQARKLQFIQEIIKLENEKILLKLEKLLRFEKNKQTENDLPPLDIHELEELIEMAENDDTNGRLIDAKKILKDIDKWQ